MPVDSDLTEAQVREFGSGAGGQRAATEVGGVTIDTDHNLQRGIEPCRD